MREVAKAFLLDFRRAVRHIKLYPQGHPLVDESLHAATTAAALLAGSGEKVLALVEDAIYLDRTLLAHESLEFNGLLRDLQARGVESITLIDPILLEDLGDLAGFAAGVSDDVPAGGSVRLNEHPLADWDFSPDDMSRLRSSYAASLDALRTVGLAMRAGGEFELEGVARAVEELLQQSLRQQGASLLLTTVKSHDEYTFYHSVNVCILSLAAGRLIGLDDSQLVPLGMGALLHDIGKVGVDAAILQHPGRLSPEQWAQIKRHPQEGASAILAASGPGQEVASAIAFEHHARFDAKGYPNLLHASIRRDPHHPGLPRAPSNFFSRLVAVVDTYDAITTRRAYRRAETPTRALHILLNAAGTSYDPDLVRAFIHMMGVYPPGSLLQLDDGSVVMVVRQGPQASGMHTVVVRDASRRLVESPYPAHVMSERIVDQVLPGHVGVDPASLLETVAA